MRKFTIVLSLTVLAIAVLGGVLAPNDPIFWLTSVAPAYQFIKVILGVGLLLQLVTDPPRHPALRITTGMIAGVAGLWTLQQIYSYQMPLLDMFALLGGAIVVLANALERDITLKSEDDVRHQSQLHA